ncbi:MAG: hypothetical protein CMO55_21465 [Verrucomicrobiales bacterium]|nr:hypothetical protein [Verrucomicrobiales bacterium]
MGTDIRESNRKTPNIYTITKMKLLSSSLLALFAAAVVSIASAEDSSLRIIKFEADWCGPCQQMKPGFEKVSKDLSSKATFQTVNVDTQKSIADQYRVTLLPTVVAVKDGKEVARITGYQSTAKLKRFVNKNS